MTKEIIENDPYKSAGVDIDAGNDLINKIKSFTWGIDPWYISNLISSLRSVDRRVFPSS